MLYKKLANGFQIIYEKPESLLPITSFNVFCNVGNVHSPKEMYGVTHFIEHMCFEGNKENPDFNKVLTMYKDYGLEYNGISTQRYTYYLIKCQDLFVETTLKLMSNELLNSNFDKKNFKKEQKIILGENGNDNDDPKRVLSNAMNKLLYEHTPFQYPTDDVSYHAKPFNYEKVVDFYKQHYIPSNMIVSIVTNIPFSKILQFIKKTHFVKKADNCETIHRAILPYLVQPPLIRGPKYSVQKKSKMNSIYLNIGFQTCSQYDLKDMHALNLLSNILGNSLSSGLNYILREKHGLVYGVMTDTTYFECGGDFTISTQFDPDSFIKKGKPSVLPLIIDFCNHLFSHG